MKLFVLRSKDGKFYRSKGYGGIGDSWVDTLEKAKFYTKIGSAKTQVTFWFKKYPQFGCPDLLVFDLDPTQATVVNMQSQTEMSIRNIKEKNARAEEGRRQWNLERAKEELTRAQACVRALSR